MTAEKRRTSVLCEKEFFCFLPRSELRASDQLRECLQALKEKLRARNLKKDHILKLSFFVWDKGPADYAEKKSEYQSILKGVWPGFNAPASFIAQAPEGGRNVVLEATLFSPLQPDFKVRHKSLDDIPYAVVEGGSSKEVIMAGLAGEEGQDFPTQAKSAFAKMAEILDAEKMTAADIVRQWNYIGNILEVQDGQAGRQNYQILNDARARFYARSRFAGGYPAATGIGMAVQGIILEAVALKAGPGVRVYPLANPRQADAHRYSQKVLVGTPNEGLDEKASPKFERAKVVASGSRGIIYVSGTAAVLGEKSTARDDVRAQTRVTIENIRALVSGENLRTIGLNLGGPLEPFSYLRVYVKREADIPSVRALCRGAFGGIPSLYVIADICREELLVEIEGAVSISI